MSTVIKITQFNPLQIQLPAVDGPVSGKVMIQLPAVHVKVKELFGPSWGSMAEGLPYLGGDLGGYGFSFDVPEDHPLELGQLVEMVSQLQEPLQRAYEEIQGVFDDKGALLDPVMG